MEKGKTQMRERQNVGEKKKKKKRHTESLKGKREKRIELLLNSFTKKIIEKAAHTGRHYGRQ